METKSRVDQNVSPASCRGSADVDIRDFVAAVDEAATDEMTCTVETATAIRPIPAWTAPISMGPKRLQTTRKGLSANEALVQSINDFPTHVAHSMTPAWR